MQQLVEGQHRTSPLRGSAARWPADWVSWWTAGLLAVGSPLAAVLLALLVGEVLPTVPPLVLLAAVVLSGYYGGLRPAIVASGLGALALDYFFETPRYALEVTDPRTVLNLIGFVVVAVPLGLLNARLRRARDESEAARLSAEASALAREELLAAVTHDLRTPLTAIRASLAALREVDPRASIGERAHLLANAEAEADHLVRLVADVLDMKRLEAGVAPAREWNAVGEVVSAVLDRCAPLLGERPLRYDVPDTLPLARFDAVLLGRVLTSLLENVATHTPLGTPYAVEARVDGADLRVVVADEGPGVPAAARERVFAKYERLDRSGPGLGLGLALARAAVEAQGGRIWVEDGPGGGARFVVSLPGIVEPRAAA